MFFTYLRRELGRRRKAALVVALGLALGIALVITVTSVSAGMAKAQDKVLQSLYGLGTDMTVTKAQPADGNGGGRPSFDFRSRTGGSQSGDRVVPKGFQTLDASTVSKVAGQEGVSEAVGGLSLNIVKVNGDFDPGKVKEEEGNPGGRRHGFGGGGSGSGGSAAVEGGGARFSVDSYSAYGVDVAHPGLGPLTSSKITSGSGFTAAQANDKVAVVDSAYAQKNGLAVGKALTISGNDYKIIGIATADSADAAANVYLPLQQAQALAAAKDKITTVYVKATSSQKISAVKSTIQQNVPGTTVTTAADLASTVSGSLSTAADLATNVGRWLSVAVLVATFLVAGLLTSSAVSRRVREFGTLKALGWRSGRITRQVMGEALVNGLLGGVLGIALGLGAAALVTAINPKLTAQLGGAGGGWGGPGGGSGEGGHGFGGGGGGGGFGHRGGGKTLEIALTAPTSLTTIGVAVALAVAGGLIAGAFGGWRASRLRPADALRRID
ncbi:ABC transporter permease [Streptomyces hesseae]|uniref:FtsX-like permease family protein n=1 Tax=Streptomyces hesseae TaxID=3075519 RepID=A0ABU2SGL7_9ACTN|nr:ABC transporter permease [Streptomyces sp. DSM 40473]MDT0448063.1 FtsX-like permease family protein [Streptomyces sp. DSM 40473]